MLQSVLNRVSLIGVASTVNKIIYDTCKHLEMHDISGLSDNDSQSTADITKWISPIITRALKKELMKIDGFIDKTGPGCDIYFNDTPIEIKTAQNKKMFSGNKHSSKVPVTLLLNYKISNGILTDIFFGVLDLSECKHGWSGGNKTSGFTNLKIHKDDIDKFTILYGELRPCRKWCEFVRNPI